MLSEKVNNKVRNFIILTDVYMVANFVSHKERHT
jgi:hypothetical protein